MADSDDEDFVVIRNPLPQYDKDEVPKKPVHIQQQKVTDSKGRQRFHGAFTGGFSAGYFNTVGSKEGWAPSTFVSARTKAAEDEESNEQRPEDFMDEEDFDEHGIAPKQVSVASDFKERERKRKTAEHSHGIIPGEAPLQNLIVPSSIPMGIQLLRKLGWKEGQGVGPRVQRKSRRQKKTVAGKKIYGCALPPANENESSSSDTEFAPENVTFAPKDINPIRFKPKNDFHGLGYSGISVPTAFGSSSSGHINLFEPMAVTKKPAVSSSGRRGMTGAAFGVGALEDDDDDVYAVDSMSNYDRVLSDNSDKNFGWTAPKHRGMSSAPVGYLGKVLEGFKLSTNTLKPKETFAPPQLPRNYKPQRHKENSQNNVNQTRSAPVSNTHNKTTFKKLDAKVRSAMLGEIGSLFDLVSDRDNQRMQSVKSAEPTPSTPQPSTSTSHIHMPSRQSPARPQISVEEQRKHGVALNKFGGGFKPFAKDPAKQNRYDQFLELKNKGIKYEPDDVGMTEWERQKEKEDFTRAAILYRPMANMMASRFTTAKFADDEKNVEITPEKSDDRKKAVEMKMFGKLTREQHEWHPDKVLCKRFNIANPYPGSSIVGVPGGAKRSNFASYDFVEENRIEPPEENMETEGPVADKGNKIGLHNVLIVGDSNLRHLVEAPELHGAHVISASGARVLDRNSTKWREQVFEPMVECLEIQPPVRIVVIHLGTNDIQENLTGGSFKFRMAIDALVRLIRSKMPHQQEVIFIWSAVLPRCPLHVQWNPTDNAETLNAVISKINIELQTYVDSHATKSWIILQHGFSANIMNQIQYWKDSVHLSPLGAKLLSSEIRQCVDQLLKQMNEYKEQNLAIGDTIRADIKPLAILANSDTGLQSVAAPPSAHRDNNVETPGVSTSDQQPDVDLTIGDAPEVKTEPTERPPMDIFKAIFSNSEDSSDSDEEDKEPRAANENQSKVIQPNLSTSVIPSEESLIQGQPLSSPNIEGTIKVESLEDRLSPPFPGEDRQDDVVVESATTESVEDLYGPAMPPPSSDIGDGAFSSGGKRKLKQKKKKNKDKKKKSKHKKHKAKDKKKKEKKKKKDKKKVTITVSSSSSGSEADEDTDSEPDNQPSDNQLLNKLKHHPKLGRMTAADFM